MAGKAGLKGSFDGQTGGRVDGRTGGRVDYRNSVVRRKATASPAVAPTTSAPTGDLKRAKDV